MRYRKSRRGFRSRIVKMKFQSFFDISTEADNMKIISVNAGGKTVFDRLAPFFSAYKYYKLGGVSVKLIPASTLPVDPSGLSYEAGENVVDPRDQLTPGMCRITNGEDILENITGLTGDQQRALYNNMLLDPRWYKWMLQTGVKRFGKPRYWQIGQLHQDKYPGAIVNMPEFAGTSDAFSGTSHEYSAHKPATAVYSYMQAGSSPRGIFQTGHKGVLGWLPTDSLQPMYNPTESGIVNEPLLCDIPQIELFKILMPPVIHTNYFYRMFVTETVYFREPVVLNLNGYRPIDVFHFDTADLPVLPTETYSPSTDSAYDKVHGGNDGSY